MKLNSKRNGKRNGKPISQFTLEGEFIKTYPSGKEAEREVGINDSHIGECCRGELKTAGGYIWKYTNKIN